MDIFYYEVPAISGNVSSKQAADNNKYCHKGYSAVSVYNFHNLNTQNRFFLFLQTSSKFNSLSKLSKASPSVSSITEIFFAAN